jgi:hypothetical protein
MYSTCVCQSEKLELGKSEKPEKLEKLEKLELVSFILIKQISCD